MADRIIEEFTGRDDAVSHKKQRVGEEGALFRSSALWYQPIPGFVNNFKTKIKPCVRAICNSYIIARKTRGNMSDVLQLDSSRESLLRFALPILTLKQYSNTLTAIIASLSSKYAQTLSAHANPSGPLLEDQGDGKCIACRLTVTHPLKMQHALDLLSEIDKDILAAAGHNGQCKNSARMFNTLLIMKEMLAYFGVSYTVSEDKTSKFTATVPHEKGEIVAAEKLCVSCQRKSEKGSLSFEALDTPTDITRLIRTCLFQLKSHIEWQECLLIGLIDAVHGLFTSDSIYSEPRKVYLGGNTFGLLSMRTVDTALVETTNNPLGVWFATRPK